MRRVNTKNLILIFFPYVSFFSRLELYPILSVNLQMVPWSAKASLHGVYGKVTGEKNGAVFMKKT